MPLDEPRWWYRESRGLAAALLHPLSLVYGAIAERRFKAAKPYRAKLPVVCVGNFTAGGTGKTPAAIAAAALLRELGREPVFLTRGYGGRLKGPVTIDPARHSAGDTGDEPLLLARTAPTVISKSRAEGARFIEATASPRTIIIMDDGLQNPSLAKDFSLAVVDAARGLGNGAVIPAGPLRAPMRFQGALSDAILLNGEEGGPAPGGLPPLPLLRATTAPDGDVFALKGQPFVAYAGIANPQRFFTLLENIGARIVASHTFRDHHGFSEGDARKLLADAQQTGAALITTEKDWVRLQNSTLPALQQLRAASRTLAVRLHFAEPDREMLKSMIQTALEKRR